MFIVDGRVVQLHFTHNIQGKTNRGLRAHTYILSHDQLHAVHLGLHISELIVVVDRHDCCFFTQKSLLYSTWIIKFISHEQQLATKVWYLTTFSGSRSAQVPELEIEPKIWGHPKRDPNIWISIWMISMDFSKSGILTQHLERFLGIWGSGSKFRS